MNTRENTFVIVEVSNDTSANYIMDFISFDKAELTKVCDAMNEEWFTKTNAQIREYNKKRIARNEQPQREQSVADYKKYDVLSLSAALDKLVDAVADYHTEHDESY